MSNTIGQFYFQLIGGETTHTSAAVSIVLKRWTLDSTGDIPSISAYLQTEREIDEHIEALKSDLDAVGSRAKAALRKVNPC